MALVIDDHPDDHLMTIRLSIFTKPELSQFLSTLPFKVQRCRIEKHHAQSGKQVPAFLKQDLFNLLGPIPLIQRIAVVPFIQGFPQPFHRPIEVMQIQSALTGNILILPPGITGQIGSGYHDAMQDRDIDRPFDIKIEFPTVQQML